MMAGANPLVARRQEATTGYTGIGIVESAVDVYGGIESGSWLETGMGLFGLGMEGLSLFADPAGTLIQYGVSWLIEHIRPLHEALDRLAGDPDQITAYAQTWRNVASETRAVAQDYLTAVNSGTADWSGAAADTYRKIAVPQTQAIAAAATCADSIATTVELAGMLVGTVRGIVRDLVAECVATLIERVWQWAAEEAVTVGLATPHVLAAASALITKWVNRITEYLKKLVHSIDRLSGLLRKLDETGTPSRRSSAAVPTPTPTSTSRTWSPTRIPYRA
jgi:hypothetical protein